MKTKNNIDRFWDYYVLFVTIGALSLSVFGILYNMLLGLFLIVILFSFVLLLGLWTYYEIFSSIEREYYENKK